MENNKKITSVKEVWFYDVIFLDINSYIKLIEEYYKILDNDGINYKMYLYYLRSIRKLLKKLFNYYKNKYVVSFLEESFVTSEKIIDYLNFYKKIIYFYERLKYFFSSYELFLTNFESRSNVALVLKKSKMERMALRNFKRFERHLFYLENQKDICQKNILLLNHKLEKLGKKP
ncbi:hypothetical protein JTY60_01515 [symbiont of Argiope bruennichi]|uniref:hypothetical protein n=1 Tax=symbiont of Argiope bruennichi TaxID=2810479 RepID=UPI003DA60C21